MAARALWKGFLAIGELSCPVGLYAAASASDRIAFRTLNRATGHPVRREFVDSVTGEPVPKEEQVKGYEVAQGDDVMFEPEEVASVVPPSDKTLTVSSFIPCREIDDVYLDKPYYLAPSDEVARPAFSVIREGMRGCKVAALAQSVLFRRVRTVLLRPSEDGIIAHTLHFDYEVRPAQEAFAGVPAPKLQREMLDLAAHIIDTKRGKFDPNAFEDRYEEALAALVRAKMEGRPLAPPKPVKTTSRSDLLDALRQSAGGSPKGPAPRPAPASKSSPAGGSGAPSPRPRRSAAGRTPAPRKAG